MIVTFSEAASRDLRLIRAFIVEDDPGAAVEVARRLDAAIRLIAAKPLIGRPSQEQGLREWSVGGLPYLIPYRVAGDSVQIVRIFHTSQRRPERWTR